MNDQAKRLSRAGRALSRAGLVHAYGHASIRLDERNFLVTPSVPLGMVGLDDPGIVVAIDGPLPEGVAGEVLVHQQIYSRRTDVSAICRVQPPKLMSLSTMGRVPAIRHGFGAYLSTAYWHDPQLARTQTVAEQLSACLEDGNAVVMRGNGAIVVADSIERAVVLAWYLEDAARVELDVMHADAGAGFVFTPEEARSRATWSGAIVERMWDYLTSDDCPPI